MQKSFIILLVSALLGGVLFFMLSSPSDNSKPVWTFHTQEKQIPMTYAESVSQQKEVQATDSALYNDAVLNESATGCTLIAAVSLKTRCQDVIGASIAQKSGDIRLCERLSDSGSKMNCEDAIVLVEAEKTIDQLVCARIHEENLRINCQKTVDEKRLKAASASGEISPDFCQSLHENFRAACKKNFRETNDANLYNGAVQSKNTMGCDGIYNEDTRDACRDVIILQKALINTDSISCSDIKNQEKKLYCMSSTVRRADSNAFQEIVAKGSIDECEKIQDTNLKNQCHDMIIMKMAREQKDATVCASLRNTGMQFPCVQMTKQ